MMDELVFEGQFVLAVKKPVTAYTYPFMNILFNGACHDRILT